MDSLNIQPILELIHSDAKTAAEKLIAEAGSRAASISEYAGRRVDEQLEDTMARGKAEADVLEDRMRRLAYLEARKELVAGKRGLMDRVFSEAIARLNATPTGQLGAMMSDLAAENAQGDETLAAGSVNDGFFTQAFVDALNARLASAGKKGQLRMDEARVPGVCGLVLKGASSQTHCTFAALMDTRREDLEARVASILFADRAD